jgi:tetratricopeptide (TPR) repeat protein
MKWPTILIAVCVFFCLATNALSGEGIGPDKNKAILFKSSNKMAEEQWATNQYSAAVETLKREIENNPRNDEAHLLLGMYYLLLGRAYLAEQSFEAALQYYNYSQKWMEKVALTYQKAALAKGQEVRLTERYLKLAGEHAPGINKELASKFFIKGKKLLTGQASSIAEANPHFRITDLCDPTIGDLISNTYFSKGQQASDADCLKFYRAANNYSKVDNEKIGHDLLSRAAQQKDKKIQTALINGAKEFVDKAFINAKFPPPS